MGTWQSGRRPITIAILAMGGEGGGVLADWIVDLGEHGGFTAQSTSVAGVAQRTGATVYYVELFPGDGDGDDNAVTDGGAARNRPRGTPVLSLFPAPGEVDVVIASELMEAGRSIQRGFCTPERTTLIASTNRVYAISEKINLGDGRAESDLLIEAAGRAAKRLISADFAALAERAGSVISASLFGALAGSGALPFTRAQFEAAVTRSGKGVQRSLAAFGLGHDASRESATAEKKADTAPARTASAPVSAPVSVTIGRRPPADPVAEQEAAAQERHDRLSRTDPAQLVGPALKGQAARVQDFPEAARPMLVHGCVRTAVYQGPTYTDTYLDRVARIAALEQPDGPALLTSEAARHTALWMCYQDTIHVALQKLRRRRMEGIRAEAGARPGQLMQVREFLHPQVEEITDTLPTKLGRRLARSRMFAKAVGRITSKGMVVNTTSALGYSMLWVTAQLRPMRPRSRRFAREQAAIDTWLDLLVSTADRDYALACEIAQLPGVLKGYGQTHAHGSESFRSLMAAARGLIGAPAAPERLARLRAAALADEDGASLRAALAALPAVA